MTVPSGPRPCGASREGAVVEARVASMVAQSEAVMATGVALVIRAGIAAMRRSTAGVSAAAAASTVREERPRYLLKGRGRGRVVTQR